MPHSRADEAEGELQLSRVRGLSFAHAGYAQLFDLADLTGDRCEWVGLGGERLGCCGWCCRRTWHTLAAMLHCLD